MIPGCGDQPFLTDVHDHRSVNHLYRYSSNVWFRLDDVVLYGHSNGVYTRLSWSEREQIMCRIHSIIVRAKELGSIDHTMSVDGWTENQMLS